MFCHFEPSNTWPQFTCPGAPLPDEHAPFYCSYIHCIFLPPCLVLLFPFPPPLIQPGDPFSRPFLNTPTWASGPETWNNHIFSAFLELGCGAYLTLPHVTESSSSRAQGSSRELTEIIFTPHRVPVLQMKWQGSHPRLQSWSVMGLGIQTGCAGLQISFHYIRLSQKRWGPGPLIYIHSFKAWSHPELMKSSGAWVRMKAAGINHLFSATSTYLIYEIIDFLICMCVSHNSFFAIWVSFFFLKKWT